MHAVLACWRAAAVFSKPELGHSTRRVGYAWIGASFGGMIVTHCGGWSARAAEATHACTHSACKPCIQARGKPITECAAKP
eukprot:366039-Chlamydomonas_euryale.AAC.4